MEITNIQIKSQFNQVRVPAEELQPDGELIIRELSGADQMRLMAEMSAGKKPTDIELAALLFHKSLVNSQGELLLPDLDAANNFIGAIPARLFNRLHKAIWDLNNGEAEKKV